ncbi:hypothetical protein SNEBB_005742 [Seison nebaliae]|nr:hypothetical protein SNEBB_005742 [Seison nebaliae]
MNVSEKFSFRQFDDEDSSDDEEYRNTIGNVPLEWYDDYDHVGYSVDGSQIEKSDGRKVNEDDGLDQHGNLDHINQFLNRMTNENDWRTLTDPQTGEKIELSEEDVEVIRRIVSRRCHDKKHDPYPEYSPFFTSKISEQPILKQPPSKQQFTRSHWERKQIAKFVVALRRGWIKMPKSLKRRQLEKRREEEQLIVKDIWRDDNFNFSVSDRLTAPSIPMPSHELSYRPPSEYLFDENEKRKFLKERLDKLENNEEIDENDVIPEMYKRLIDIPSYSRFVKDRYERCLDLCLSIRKEVFRPDVKCSKELLPQLPHPTELRPFPTTLHLKFNCENSVCSFDIHPDGEWMISGNTSNEISFWQILTSRKLWFFQLPAGRTIQHVAFNPIYNSFVVVQDENIHFFNLQLSEKMLKEKMKNFIEKSIENSNEIDKHENFLWRINEGMKSCSSSYLLTIESKYKINKFVWHSKGDYFATISNATNSGTERIAVHQFSNWRSVTPFQKMKNISKIADVQFHPNKSIFYVAHDTSIRVYDFKEQQIVKILKSTCETIESICCHHSAGEHLLVCGLNGRVNWFDVDLSLDPYKQLKYHKTTTKFVDFHKQFPLFASSSTDGNIVISHGMVYSDVLKNPFIVPLKILRHQTNYESKIISIHFHPQLPWIFIGISNFIYKSMFPLKFIYFTYSTTKNKFYYAVRRGRRSGIYHSWEECREQVDKFPNSKFKKFLNIDEAIDYVMEEDLTSSGKKEENR